jgi:hypothetical protein
MRRSVGSICRNSRATDRAVGVAVLRKTRLRPGFLWLFVFGLVVRGERWRLDASCLEWVGQPCPGPAVNPSMGARSAPSMAHYGPGQGHPTHSRQVHGSAEGRAWTPASETVSAGCQCRLDRRDMPGAGPDVCPALCAASTHGVDLQWRARQKLRGPQSALISQPKP